MESDEKFQDTPWTLEELREEAKRGGYHIGVYWRTQVAYKHIEIDLEGVYSFLRDGELHGWLAASGIICPDGKVILDRNYGVDPFEDERWEDYKAELLANARVD